VVGNRDIKNIFRLLINGDKLQVQFAFPLDKTGARIKQLKGRYLNGIANLDLKLENGFLTLHVTAIDINGQPIPRWIWRVSRLRDKNLLENLENNMEFTQFLQEIDDVVVKEGAIVCTPYVAK
jgi:hypothetical protein